jgi:hypothetical protein
MEAWGSTSLVVDKKQAATIVTFVDIYFWEEEL